MTGISRPSTAAQGRYATTVFWRDRPHTPGLGWQLDHLAVLAAWFVVAAVLAAPWSSWQPRHEG